MIQQFQEFVQGLPEPLQWLGVMLVSAIPLIESYFGSVIGVVAGIFAPVAVLCAVIGNVVSMLVFVLSADRARKAVTKNKEPKQLTPRKQKLKERLDRYGVPAVSLLGQTVLPSQITSAAMVSFGANTRQVIIWQIISIVIWGVIFGALAAGGMYLVR